MLMLIKLTYNFVDILMLVVKYTIHVHAFIEHINHADILCKGALHQISLGTEVYDYERS